MRYKFWKGFDKVRDKCFLIFPYKHTQTEQIGIVIGQLLDKFKPSIHWVTTFLSHFNKLIIFVNFVARSRIIRSMIFSVYVYDL